MIPRILIISLIICSHAFASFQINSDEEWGSRTLQFNDRALMEEWFSEEISLNELVDRSSTKLEDYLKELIKCESISDEEVVDKCLQDLREEQVTSFHLSVPSFMFTQDTRLQNFSDKLVAALKKKVQKLRATKKILDEFEEGNWNSFLVSRLTFKAQGNTEFLEEALRQLEAFPANTIDKNRYCDVRFTQNSVELFNSYEVVSQSNQKKCGDLISKYINWSSGIIKPYELEDRPFPLLRPEYKKLIVDRVDFKLANKIYASKVTSLYKKGEVKNLVPIYIVNSIARYAEEIVKENSDIQKSIEYIVNTSPENKVKYEGITGVHDFINTEFRDQVVAMTASVSADHNLFSTYVTENQLAEYFKDTNTTEEASRLEPIDLLSNLLYRKLKTGSWSKVDPPTKNYFKGVIKKMIGLTEELEYGMHILPREDNDEPEYFCALPDEETKKELTQEFSFLYSEGGYGSGTVVGGGTVIVDPTDGTISDNQSTEKNLRCGDANYQVTSEERNDPPILDPSKITIKDGYIDIIMPYSLTAEINENFKRMAKIYFKALKFDFESTVINDVKSFVKTEIKKTDVFMPAGHTLASRHLTLGTSKAELFSFTREAKRGEKYGVRFKIIIPESGGKNVSMSINEMSEAYGERIRLGSDPLVVFVISCWSESNLRDWSLIYRKVLEREGKDFAKLPYVIASERGFPTSSNTDIASSIFFPTDVANLLAKGRSPVDLYNFFMKRKYGSIAKELFKRIGTAWLPIRDIYKQEKGLLGGIFKKPESEFFEPVYNLTQENRDIYLNMSGLRYRIYREGNLIYDETY